MFGDKQLQTDCDCEIMAKFVCNVKKKSGGQRLEEKMLDIIQLK